jgi:hypothetical protein
MRSARPRVPARDSLGATRVASGPQLFAPSGHRGASSPRVPPRWQVLPLSPFAARRWPSRSYRAPRGRRRAPKAGTGRCHEVGAAALRPTPRSGPLRAARRHIGRWPPHKRPAPGFYERIGRPPRTSPRPPKGYLLSTGRCALPGDSGSGRWHSGRDPRSCGPHEEFPVDCWRPPAYPTSATAPL